MDERSNTFRGVYTVKFPAVVYVLHVFQKKSKRGIKTPQHEIDLIRKRLRMAAEHYQRRQLSKKEKDEES